MHLCCAHLHMHTKAYNRIKCGHEIGCVCASLQLLYNIGATLANQRIGDDLRSVLEPLK